MSAGRREPPASVRRASSSRLQRAHAQRWYSAVGAFPDLILMKNKSFTDKHAAYYNFDKARIAALISKGPHRVLDVGCAAGRLGRKLREQDKVAELVGVEIFEAPASEAARFYDRVYTDDIETLELPLEEYFDYIICGDILEHLRDPWSTLEKLHRLLKPQGVIIASIPNIRYWRILRDLVFLGKWEYVDSGILDNTHLRFFTRNSFLDTLQRAHFQILFDQVWINGRKQALLNRLTCGVFEDFLGSQVMVTAVKATRQGSVD
jgi:2-polyprenyl-3-methyl-5-hydroxy-6-metoxy-1,4-benzoquinol methylase